MRNHLRNFVTGLVRACGYGIMREDRIPNATIGVLELAFAALPSKTESQIVQIGANDGCERDPLRHLIQTLNLPAVLVEPVPAAFERLRSTYHMCDKVRYENCAIGRLDGESILYVPDDERQGLGSQIASFDRQHLVRHGVSPDRIVASRVPTLTMKTLLAKHGLTRIDVLVTDTEGFDLEIIRQVLDMGIKPAILQFENCNLCPSDKWHSRQLLQQQGYRYFETLLDTVAVSVDEGHFGTGK